jgi:hypothetical protein
MLPGLRFLFAAIVLSISLLIFGLGAAALLRTAHQEFASIPSRPAPPERVFAPQGDVALPALAMLRIDAETIDEETSALPATEDIQAAVPETSPSIAAAAMEPLAPEPDSPAFPVTPTPQTQSADASISEPAARTDTPTLVAAPPVSEAPSASAMPPATEVPAAAEVPSPAETKFAAGEPATPSPASQATLPAPEQPDAATLTADDAAIKIATLGGPAVEIEMQASPTKAKQKSRDVANKKRLKAERAAQRRKAARRAIAMRRASQAPADPFGAQPFGGFPGVSPRSR